MLRMTSTTLAMLLFLAPAAVTVAHASPADLAATSDRSFTVDSVQQDPPAAPPADKPALDVNISVNDDAPAQVWYLSPVWIAIWIIAGVLVLTLLILAARGGGSSAAPAGTTIVK
jgi:hypothetical protein